MKRRLLTFAVIFVIVKKSKVSLIHQTACTFLLTRKAGLPISIDRGRSHEHIALVCMKFLSDAPKWREKFSLAQDSNPTSDRQSITHAPLDEPFLSYATTYWAYHVSCASVEVGKSEGLLASVFEFLERYALLWINAVALDGNLWILMQSAAFLKHGRNEKPITLLMIRK